MGTRPFDSGCGTTDDGACVHQLGKNNGQEEWAEMLDFKVKSICPFLEILA
jgi:hypothetical protein